MVRRESLRRLTSSAVHETPARETSGRAKLALIDAYESRGWDPLQARAKSSQLWGDRGRADIDKDDLYELIGKALESEGPNDNSYQSPVEDVKTTLV